VPFHRFGRHERIMVLNLEIGSVFAPASPMAEAILRLLYLLAVLGAGVLLVIGAVVIISAIRFRDRGGPLPEPGERRRAEIYWILGAALLLVVILVATVRTMRAVDPPVEGRSPDLLVTGHQFWWEVRYPASGVVAANEIHIPVGRPLLLRVESADVIHNFWVPQLARKIDATPGHPVTMWLQADAPGVYLGACGEFCGVEHAWMRIRVIADTAEAFAAWQEAQSRAPARPATRDAVAGERLFTQLACANCHASTVAVGPDLNHLASRQTLAGGVISNTPDNLARWLANPNAVKPGSLMPDFHLGERDVRQLVAYLETLR
jgi:cytochrome c oxidase subunit II